MTTMVIMSSILALRYLEPIISTISCLFIPIFLSPIHVDSYGKFDLRSSVPCADKRAKVFCRYIPIYFFALVFDTVSQ